MDEILELALKQFGWAKGVYMIKECHACKAEFIADKRAVRCRECAKDMYIEQLQSRITELEAMRETLRGQCSGGSP